MNHDEELFTVKLYAKQANNTWVAITDDNFEGEGDTAGAAVNAALEAMYEDALNDCEGK